MKRKTIKLDDVESHWPMSGLILSGAVELERRGRWPLRYYVLVVRDRWPFEEVMTVWRSKDPMPRFKMKEGEWTESDDSVAEKEVVSARSIPNLVLSEDQAQQWGTRIVLRLHGSGHYYSVDVHISIDFVSKAGFDDDRYWFRQHVGDHFDLIAGQEGEVALWHHGTSRRWRTGARDGVRST